MCRFVRWTVLGIGRRSAFRLYDEKTVTFEDDDRAYDQARDRAARDKGLVDLRLQQIRWQLEELRISLFAQEVKTAFPVSLKRLQKRWEELGL